MSYELVFILMFIVRNACVYACSSVIYDGHLLSPKWELRLLFARGTHVRHAIGMVETTV